MTETIVELPKETNAFRSLEVSMRLDTLFTEEILSLCRESSFTKSFFQAMFKEYLQDLENV